jgi:hypothetical protein
MIHFFIILYILNSFNCANASTFSIKDYLCCGSKTNPTNNVKQIHVRPGNNQSSIQNDDALSNPPILHNKKNHKRNLTVASDQYVMDNSAQNSMEKKAVSNDNSSNNPLSPNALIKSHSSMGIIKNIPIINNNDTSDDSNEISQILMNENPSKRKSLVVEEKFDLGDLVRQYRDSDEGNIGEIKTISNVKSFAGIDKPLSKNIINQNLFLQSPRNRTQDTK